MIIGSVFIGRFRSKVQIVIKTKVHLEFGQWIYEQKKF